MVLARAVLVCREAFGLHVCGATEPFSMLSGANW